MEHFISVVIPKKKVNEESVVSMMENSISSSLMENESLIETGLTEDNSTIIQYQVARDLTNEEADEAVNTLADKMFEAGYNDFDIYVSGDMQ
jgi:proteasome assembly chaperone (PAC2) family protein